MNFLFKALALVAAAVAGSVVTVFYMKKDKSKMDCGKFLAIGRKRLIKEMNKDIEEREERLSQKNHEKVQKELNNMDWNMGSSCTS